MQAWQSSGQTRLRRIFLPIEGQLNEGEVREFKPPLRREHLRLKFECFILNHLDGI